MNEAQKDAIKEKFKELLENVSSFNTWLLVINLTIIVTFFQQESRLSKSKKNVQVSSVMLNYPWDSLQRLYDLTNGPLENYLETKAIPTYQLCLATSIESMRMKANLKDKTTSPTINYTIEAISYSGRILADYNADLRTVAYAQKAGKNFESLDRLTLKALVHVFSFKKGINFSSFERGLGKADTSAMLLLYLDKQREKDGNGTYSAEFRRVLTYFDGAPKFRDFNGEMILQDMRTFGDHRISEKSLDVIDTSLNNTNLESIGAIRSGLASAKERLSEIETGQFFEIPLVKIQISLLQFIIFGGVINLIILLCLLLVLKDCQYFWSLHKLQIETTELKPMQNIYFYSWSFGIRNARFFKLLYAAFLSFVSIASLAFAIVVFKFADLNWPVISLFAGVNFILALFCANKYWVLSR